MKITLTIITATFAHSVAIEYSPNSKLKRINNTNMLFSSASSKEVRIDNKIAMHNASMKSIILSRHPNMASQTTIVCVKGEPPCVLLLPFHSFS